MTVLGLDLSHFQGAPDFAQVKGSGRSFVVHKATEGTSYLDPMLARNRKAAHDAGLIVGLYHFARAGNPATEAAWFVHSIGTLQPGEFLVLDWEVPAADPVGWCRAWLAAVTAATGVKPLIYMNSSAMNGSNWTPLTSDFGLWLARYDNSQAQPAVQWWPAAAMKQYSDKGAVPGVSGPCDVDVFYGTTAQLLAYANQGDEDMPLTDADVAKILDWGVRQPDGGVRTLSQMIAADVGYGQRIERIDEGLHGGWGYGARIEDIQAKVDQAQAPQVDAEALAAALVSDQAAVDKLADALAAALASRLQS